MRLPGGAPAFALSLPLPVSFCGASARQAMGTWCKSSIAVFQAVDSGASPDVPATPPWCEENEHARFLPGSVKVQLLPAAFRVRGASGSAPGS